MATAKKTTAIREVVKTEEVEVIHLELSREEAEAMAVVYAKIAGSRARSHRAYTHSVSEALSAAGIQWNECAAYDSVTGGLSFRDVPGLHVSTPDA